MKILVCGSRDWTDLTTIGLALVDAVPDSCVASDVTVIEGDCRGADKLSERAARALGMKVKPYPADWTKHGKAAGHIRNQQMLDENPDIDLVLAFPLGGPGTADMIRRARAAGVKVLVFGPQKPVLGS